MTSAKMKGEEAFAESFQFFPFVPQGDRDILRDYFYKFAHNYDEAIEYLQILKQLSSIDYTNKSNLLFRIDGMALQCFAISMRRMTDNASERSVQRLINKVVKVEFRTGETRKVKDVYSHYEIFLNKGIVHQDGESTKEVFEAFPNADVIEADLVYLKGLYLKLANELCTSYISLSLPLHDYGPELRKLVIK